MRTFTESDVISRLKMADVIAAVEAALRDLGAGRAQNLPRRRASSGKSQLHLMGAADDRLGLLGYKAYATGPGGAKFAVGLFDAATSVPLASVEADYLGQLRTGAASGVATKYLARTESSTVGVFGTGKQARTQLEAITIVRHIQSAFVYSRSVENRQRFAEEMSDVCGVEVTPVEQPEDAAKADIVITATTSRTPVLRGEWLQPGTHLNVVGSNYANKTEVDIETVRRSKVFVDSREACREEAGDLIAAVNAGVLRWEDCAEIGAVLNGAVAGRQSAEDITLFKSVGLATEDLAAAALLLDESRQCARD
ncbi:MAG: ornithine cyclodeaminase family protein [Gemmataceae bacterium]